ncbi:hypothetical protein DPX16_12563 [Anabarilius grahami]|uniref:Uncharacterized protein n=1 Tax=Anabarilius grahami TaxID=495550 RepID=A0A3N0YLB9_ANAGA|nr:hypothetical protein DPX16_12563 [Anabarilius grahami]
MANRRGKFHLFLSCIPHKISLQPCFITDCNPKRMNLSREPITNRARGQKLRRSLWVRLFELVRLRLLSSSSAEDAAAAVDAKVTSRQHACSGLLMTSPGDIISDGRGLVEGVWAAVAESNTASNSEREKDSYTLHKASRGSVKISLRFLPKLLELQEISIKKTEELHLRDLRRKGQEFERNGAFRAHIYPSFFGSCTEPVSFLLKSDQSRSVSTPSLRRPERSVLNACDSRSYITLRLEPLRMDSPMPVRPEKDNDIISLSRLIQSAIKHSRTQKKNAVSEQHS